MSFLTFLLVCIRFLLDFIHGIKSWCGCDRMSCGALFILFELTLIRHRVCARLVLGWRWDWCWHLIGAGWVGVEFALGLRCIRAGTGIGWCLVGAWLALGWHWICIGAGLIGGAGLALG